MAEYRFLLIQSVRQWHRSAGFDTDSFTPWNHLVLDSPAAKGSWSWGMNRAGSATLTIHDEQLRLASSAGWQLYQPLSGVSTNLFPGSLTLWIERDGRAIWAGMVTDMQMSSEQDGVTLSAEEFTGYYDRLRLSTNFSQAAQYTWHLVEQLLSIEGAASVQMPMYLRNGGTTGTLYAPDSAGSPSDIIVDTELHPPGWVDPDLHSPLWYSHENHKIGDLIRTLQGIGSGFEWRQVLMGDFTQRSGNYPTWAGSQYTAPSGTMSYQGSQGWIAKFGLYKGKMGITRTNPSIEFGEGAANTVHKADWTFSVRQTANRVKVVGFGSGSQAIQHTATSTLRVFYGLFDPVPLLDVTYSDQRLTSQALVDAKADYILERIGHPTLNVRVETVPGDTLSLDSIGLGDRIYTRMVKGGLDLSAWLRVGSMAMQTDYNNHEVLTMELSADTESFSA